MTQSFAERALHRLEEGDGGATEAHNIRAYLVNTLELTKRDPGIDAAADDLYAAATALVVRQGIRSNIPSAGERRVLREAFLRLEGKLASARPSDKARGMGLE